MELAEGPYNDPVEGFRLYPVNAQTHFPSVSSVIDATMSWDDKRVLENWNAKNPGKAEAARNFGTTVHRLCEQYLCNGRILTHADYRAMVRFGQLKSLVLDRLERVIWCEGHRTAPVKFVHHEEYGFAGCPDWIGLFRDPVEGTAMTLMDLKTSSKPYCRWQPTKRVGKDYRTRLFGYKKFVRTRMQIAAYVQAANHLFDLGIKRGAIIVSLEDDLEYYPLSQSDLNKGWSDFQHRLDIYYRKVQEGKLRPVNCSIPQRYIKEKKGAKDGSIKTPGRTDGEAAGGDSQPGAAA